MSDPDAVWHGRWDGSRDEADSGFLERETGRGNLGGANMERHIVTNGGLFTIGNSHIAAQRGRCLANSYNCGRVGGEGQGVQT